MVHYEYYSEDHDTAYTCYCILRLLMKINVGVEYVEVSYSHVGDITLSVGYKSSRNNA